MRYWIKLYTEIVHDPKMGRLTDRQFRTCINLFAMAGEIDREGELPELDDMAWQLRMNPEDLTADLVALAAVNIVAEDDGIWTISKWAERQAKAPSAAPDKVLQRVHEHRERKRNDTTLSRNEDVTTLHHEVKRDVTPPEKNRVEKNRIEVETEEKDAPAPPSPAQSSASSGRAQVERLKRMNAQVSPELRTPIANVVLDMTGKRALADIGNDAADRLVAEAHESAIALYQMGYKTESQVLALEPIWAEDWRGKNGGSLKQLVEFASERLAGRSNGKSGSGREPVAIQAMRIVIAEQEAEAERERSNPH